MQTRYALQETGSGLLPGWRINHCLRSRLGGAGGLVGVVQHACYGSASYIGLQTCGSVWVCPVCGAKVAARRQAEIETGAGSWRAKGGGFVLATFTLRHSKAETLASVMTALNEAHRQTRMGRFWQKLRKQYGIVGAITSREITYGANGWHPHLHSIWFFDKPLTQQQMTHLYNVVSERWIKKLQHIGSDATKAHGFDLRAIDTTNDEAFKEGTDYIVKQGSQWSATDELVGGGAKQAKNGNRSVAELLKAAGSGDTVAARLFVEYAHATKGRNLVVWTPGLRELCGLLDAEKSDGELVTEQEAGGEIVCMLPPDQWDHVVAHKLRGKLLAALQRGGRDELAAWCELHSVAPLWEVPKPGEVEADL
jgi:hypothetical protein